MSYGAVKYLMIFEREGQLVEKPFETSIPFPSTGSGLYVCVNDHSNRMRLRELVLDRIKDNHAHVRTYRHHQRNVVVSYAAPEHRALSCEEPSVEETKAITTPMRPAPALAVKTVANMLALRIAARNQRKA